ncbi:MAG: TIR domain-containing protein [Isosphaeraceae bacterium]
MNEVLEALPNIDQERDRTTLILLAILEVGLVSVSVLLVFAMFNLVAGEEKRTIERNLSSRFRVALSFAGEYRKFVGEVAEYLGRELGRPAVLYDLWYDAELARPNLHHYLEKIYRDQSDLLVVFLCAEYDRKDWCRLEWGTIHGLILGRQEDQLMLVRIGDGDVSGIVPADGYLPVGDRSSREIAGKILERLALVGR